MNKLCIQCGKPLNKNQNKYCSKNCESLYKKGKSKGHYNYDRVMLMTTAKKTNYYKRYIDPYIDIINNLIKDEHLNNLSCIKRKFEKITGEKESILSTYLKDNPKICQDIKNHKKYPLAIQEMNLNQFLNLKDDLNNKIDISFLSKKYNILEDNIKRTSILLNSPYKKENGKVSKKKKDLKIIEDHKIFLIDILSKEFICEDQFDYENQIKDIANKIGCSSQSIKDFILKENLKIKINYSQARKIRNTANKLDITKDDYKKILEDLNSYKNYFEVHKEYLKLFEVYKNKYSSIYKDKSNSNLLQEFQKDLELSSPYLKELRLESKRKYSNSEYRLRLSLGTDLIDQFIEELNKCNNYKDWLSLNNKFIKIFGFKGNYLPDNFKKTFSKFYELSQLSVRNTISNQIGGSSAERKVMNILNELNIPYEMQIPLKSLKSKYGTYHIDFVLNKKDCIEVQGDYWHANPIMFMHDVKLINSVYPNFKYKNRPIKNKKNINDHQRKGLEVELLKRKAIENNYGKNHLYYIWEYDLNNHIDTVTEFLKEKFT